MYYRISAKDYNAGTNPQHKAALRNLIAQHRMPGLLAYRDGEPAGWCALGPRADFPRLAHSRVFAPVDETPAWLIVCFFTQRRLRGRGVATHLLQASLAYSREQGAAAVDACPVEVSAGRATDAWIFPGVAAMFRAAGFREVARRSPTRPLMRYAFAPAVPAGGSK